MKKEKECLYGNLADTLRKLIKEEKSPHDALPSERELTKIYGVSRTTVRLALLELEQSGYIYRKHGKGTFVSGISSGIVNLTGSYSFTDQMHSLGKKPQTNLLSFEIRVANEYFSENLEVSLGALIVRIKRLRLADGEPMMVERTYLPYEKFKTLTPEMISLKPLYKIFVEDYDEPIKYAAEEFYASFVNKNDGTLLKVPEGSPALNLQRKTYNQMNELVEFTLSVSRADQFRYQVLHQWNEKGDEENVKGN